MSTADTHYQTRGAQFEVQTFLHEETTMCTTDYSWTQHTPTYRLSFVQYLLDPKAPMKCIEWTSADKQCIVAITHSLWAYQNLLLPDFRIGRMCVISSPSLSLWLLWTTVCRLKIIFWSFLLQLVSFGKLHQNLHQFDKETRWVLRARTFSTPTAGQTVFRKRSFSPGTGSVESVKATAKLEAHLDRS